ncbi:Rv3235 family protein [Kitasatospora sp. NBC_00240]|uniref:Rv3235 family protein n=1 Tax=Kitasatospora sp. NBC_00240 TaxID=2903567 RepID=UPI0022533FFB|nr:Rv3235 family protein [Kitasatospora sp. NBC_00240]MCX5212635.1 Rv3235 family protein [Kitasatospora sp. NBC_00240]
MIESSASPHSAVRPALAHAPAVRGPRIRPLARQHEPRRHEAPVRHSHGHGPGPYGSGLPAGTPLGAPDAAPPPGTGHVGAGHLGARLRETPGHEHAPPGGRPQPAHHRAPQHPPGPHRAAAPRHPRHPREACAPARAGDIGTGTGTGTERAVRAELAARFALRLVEVLTGVRPAGQLQRHTTLDGYGGLTSLVRSGPLRPRGAAARPRLGRVHDSAPSAEAVEACVRVELGPRHHMVAFRLERHRRTGQWQCAAVEAR